MTGLLCNYAIIRFLPYKEIGEFVNVGVVVHCPETGFFDFKLADGRNGRVNTFFPELDRPIYRVALEALARELNRHRAIEGLFTEQRRNQSEVLRGLNTFRQLLERREAMLQFASPGSLVADPSKAVNELFGRYVKRNFATTPEYQETTMRHRLRQLLKDWGLRQKYQTDQTVGDHMFRLKLPFVYQRDGDIVKALRPLDLDRGEPTKVFEHGDIWVQRMRRLNERGQLPKQMIFAIRLPADAEPRSAADMVRSDLSSNRQVQVVDIEETDTLRTLVEI